MNIPSRIKLNYKIHPSGHRKGKPQSMVCLTMELDGEPVGSTQVIAAADSDDIQEFYEGDITLQTLRDRVRSYR